MQQTRVGALPTESAPRLPVAIVTGFLGSGKTSLLNRLIAAPQLARSLVVINEFGAIGLDHLLIDTPDDNLLLLDNGCLCCINRGDLVETLHNTLRRWQAESPPAFDRIIIETSGLADPAPIIQSVVGDRKLSDRLRMQAVVTVVDCINAEQQLESHPESVKQVVVADLLLLSKIDLADADTVAAVRARITRLNAGAAIVGVDHSAAIMSVLTAPPAVSDVHAVGRWLGFSPAHAAPPRGTLPRTPADHLSAIQSVSLHLERPVYWNGLTLWLQMLPALKGDRLLRVKGLLNVEGRPVAVHIVHAVVHEPQVLERWPDDDHRSRLVFIGLDLQREELEAGLDVLSYAGSPVTAGFAVEPAAYAEFLNVATRMR
ncbi:MAG: GTP-binding protein [Burkholderiales bacterium]|nr:GTP-binding protein [Burkholderiales bacterium]